MTDLQRENGVQLAEEVIRNQPDLSRWAKTFIRFHAKHPDFYEEVRRLAVQVKNCGYKQWSMRNLFSYLCYTYSLKQGAEKTGGEGFKLNVNMTPYYSRLMMDNEPLLRGFFEIRRQLEQPHLPALLTPKPLVA